jgi:SAM-dependent methyltransferase
MKIQDKMKQDWDRRAQVDPYYWVAATQEADLQSYESSAQTDCEGFLKYFLGGNWDESLAKDKFKDQALLDLGCGIGRMTAPLANYFQRSVGVDVSEQMILKAKELHQSITNAEFICNSGTDLSMLADGSIDIACSYSVLAHLPADVTEAYFLEIGRILKTAGFFRYQFWVGPQEKHPQDQDSLSIHVYSEAQLKNLHEQAGLEIIHREEIDYFDPILELKPLWITAKKIQNPQATKVVNREIDQVRSSDDEVMLEYDLLLYLAMKHQERDEIVEAERVLSEAIQFEPNRPEAYLHWTSIRLSMDDLINTVKILEELSSRCPKSIDGWLYLAQVYQAQSLPFKALNCLRTCDELLKKEYKALLVSQKDLSIEAFQEKESRILNMDAHRKTLLKEAQNDSLKIRKQNKR